MSAALARGPDRGRRRPVPGRSPLDWLDAVRRDPRMADVPSSARWALMVAVLAWGDAEGRFWPSLEAWAREAMMPRPTLKKAVQSLVKAGLIVREPHLRESGRTASNTYRPTVRPPVESAGATPGATPGAADKGDHGRSPLRPTQTRGSMGGPPEGSMGGPPEGVHWRAPLNRGKGGTGVRGNRGKNPEKNGSTSLREARRSLSDDLADLLAPLLAGLPDPPTRAQEQALQGAWDDDPETFTANAWDAWRSDGVGQPLLVLLDRIAEGRVGQDGDDPWHRVVERWEGAGRPRPGEPAPSETFLAEFAAMFDAVELPPDEGEP